MGALIIMGALMASQMPTFRELTRAGTASHLHDARIFQRLDHTLSCGKEQTRSRMKGQGSIMHVRRSGDIIPAVR